MANGYAYAFSVTANNAVGAGPASARSALVVPRTVAAAPRTTGVTAGEASATVSWTRPYDGGLPIDSFVVHVYKGKVLVRTVAVPGGVTRLTMPRLARVRHTFTVTAVTAAGAGPASGRSASVTPRR